jgi:hypothetical protein
MKNEMEEIKKLYHETKNVTAFFSDLNKKSNANLKNFFNDFKNKTCYFPFLKGSTIQTLYNILNNITDYQVYSDGRTKNF